MITEKELDLLEQEIATYYHEDMQEELLAHLEY